MVDADSLTKIAGLLTVGLAGISLGFQQVLKKWKSTSAETTVLTLLHTEIERMGKQNIILSEFVNSLQLEATKITLELGKLQIENQKLHAEVVCLTKEVISLQIALLPKTRKA